MIDCNKTDHEQWEEGFWQCEGLRVRSTNLRHGIVREVLSERSIGEGTYCDGKQHGLYRWIYDDKVEIELFYEGILKAFFSFGFDFQEIERGGSEVQLLDELTVKKFEVL